MWVMKIGEGSREKRGKEERGRERERERGNEKRDILNLLDNLDDILISQNVVQTNLLRVVLHRRTPDPRAVKEEERK